MQDIELIEGCAHNNRESQKEFYNRYCPMAMGVCTRYSANEKEAESMALFVFGKLFKEIDHCPLDGDIIKWIEERMIWNAVQYLHQDKHKYFIAKTTLYVENKPSYSKDIESAMLSDEVSRKLYLSSLQALTPSYRILYNLSFIDDIPSSEIIKNLQIAEETYRTELDEARYQFKKFLTIRLNEQSPA